MFWKRKKKRPPGTANCPGCGRKVSLVPISAFINQETISIVPGADFVCAACGEMVGQVFYCQPCNRVWVIDRTVEGTRPGWCATCGFKGQTQHRIQLPMS